MAEIEMAEDKPESSKAGLRRMQRLASLPGSYQPCQHASIQPETAQLIYTSNDPNAPASITTIFGRTKPRPLPTSPILLPPTGLSVSPTGEWITAFHPSPPVPGLVTEGGTVAIYSRRILDVTSTPTRTLAHATFSLPTSPLCILQLYPPRSTDAAGKAGAFAGPRPPPGYTPNKGPAFMVLTRICTMLFAPDRNGTMRVLRAPLHTRCSSSADSESPPEMGKRVDKGTLAILPGEEGVWAGWQVDEEVRVTRFEIGMDRMGNLFLRSTPMSTLPVLQTSTSGERVIDQGVAFVALKHNDAEGQPNGVQMNGYSTYGTHGRTNKIGAVLIQRLENAEGTVRTRMSTVAFERRENEVAHAFTELSGEENSGRTWDWFTSPCPTSESISPPNTTVVALCPLRHAPSRTTAVAVLSRPADRVLVSLDLCPQAGEPEDQWNAIASKEVPLPSTDIDDLELIVSLSVESGGLGLVGLVAAGRVTWVVSPSDSEEAEALAREASKSISLAIRQDVSYSDVVRAVVGTTPKAQRGAMAVDILKNVHDTLRSSNGIDALEEIFRLQTALFSASHDSRKTLSRELVQFCQARQILASCAEKTEGSKISFDIDSLWSLLDVSDWIMISLASAFRELIALQGKLEWEEPDISLPTASRAIYIIHPHLRFLIVDLLFYVKAYINFSLSLDQSISPPPNRSTPMATRDPRVTVLLKDCVRDLEMKYGLEIDTWGKALTALNIKAGLADKELASAIHTLSLESIQPLVMPTLASLPSPSSLLLAEQDEGAEYDVITFTILPPSQHPHLPEAKSGIVSCDRCSARTAIFRDKIIAEGTGTALQAPLSAASDRTASGAWNEWKRAGEIGCGCGGTWI